MTKNICTRIHDLSAELSKYPDAYLVYKTIHNRKQPYLQQIEARGYARELAGRGFTEEQILRYGIAFDGKDVCVKR